MSDPADRARLPLPRYQLVWNRYGQQAEMEPYTNAKEFCADADVARLEAEHEQLLEWKASALAALQKSDGLHARLCDHSEYLGWEVHEAVLDLLEKTEAKVQALRAGIEELANEWDWCEYSFPTALRALLAQTEEPK